MSISFPKVLFTIILIGIFTNLIPAQQPIGASLIIKGPGKPLFSRWGHAGLQVKYSDGSSQVFDFGLFSPASERFLQRTLEGRAIYSGDSFEATYYLEYSIEEEREISRYDFNLGLAELELLNTRLESLTSSEQRDFVYDHFSRNCATILRDLINEVTGGALVRATIARPAPTYRQLAASGTVGLPGVGFAVNLLLGPDADQPITVWQEMFLPDVLGREVAGLMYTDANGIMRNFSGSPEIISIGRDRSDRYSSSFGLFLTILAAVLLGMMNNPFLFAAFNDSWFLRGMLVFIRILLGLISGGIGGILIFTSYHSNSEFLQYNLNIFFVPVFTVFSVLTSLLMYIVQGKKRLLVILAHRFIWGAALASLLVGRLFLQLGDTGQDVSAVFIPMLIFYFLSADFIFSHAVIRFKRHGIQPSLIH